MLYYTLHDFITVVMIIIRVKNIVKLSIVLKLDIEA